MFGLGLTAVAGGLIAKKMFSEQASADSASNEVKNVEITWASELEEGQMRAIKVGDQDGDKVLIARYQGKLYSTGNFCSHFGVPLEGGMLFDDKVMCPAHAAGFSIVTGQPESAPGLDGLPSFPVVEVDGRHFVQVPKEGLPRKVSMPTARRDPADKRHFVIVGGGCAGLNCAETLRQSGFTGQITVLSKEDVLPYDRTLITKALPVGDASKWALRPDQYLRDMDVDYVLSDAGWKVDREQKKVITTRGKQIHYDKLCLAPGSDVFKPPVPGINSKNVHFVRTHKDQKDIKDKAAAAKSIVVVGSSFIGSESAASLAAKYGKEKQIHMLCEHEVPFKLQLGAEIGKMMLKEHRDNNVTVHTQVMAKSINADADGKVHSVTLSDGSTVEADLVIVGAGVRPNTQWLKESGLEMDRFGGLICDPFLGTNDKDIFAAGDIASYPYWPTGGRVRSEHWVTALDQGSYAAFNMLGKMAPYG